MEIVKLESPAEVARRAAVIVADSVSEKPDLVLGLATGKSVIGLYRELARMCERRKIDFSRVQTFNLDEYADLSPTSRTSLRSFMDENFFNLVNVKKSNIHFLRGDCRDSSDECGRYEKAIKDLGGIDLQILGIGRNGHIGFNEPGSKLKSRTRRVKLSVVTRRDNAGRFGTWRDVPAEALTVGVRTILSARKILLLATGESKEDAVRRAVRGRVGEKVPASFLQRHKNAVFLLDSEAARGL